MEQTNDIERIQKTCLKVILGANYIDYLAALEMTGLDTLFQRREQRCLNFALKCLKDPVNRKLFPVYTNLHNEQQIRNRETITVNFCRTEAYRDSAIPYCTRKLNKYFADKRKQ